MAMSRFCGGMSLARSPPIRRSPELISSSPAIMRSSVDLPHPDGPTSTTNSPSATDSEMSWSTVILPYRFDTETISRCAIQTSMIRLRNGRFPAISPASTLSVTPVIPPANGEARNAAAIATSRGLTSRPSG